MRSLIVMGALLLQLGVAQAGDWVLGVNYGVAKGDTGAGDLNADLQARGLDAEASSSDDSRTAWRYTLGYEYTPRLGVEFAYVDLGKVETTFSGTAVDIDSFLSSVDDLHPQTAKGWLLGGKYRHGIYDWLHLHGRLGVFSWRSKYTVSGANTSRDVTESGLDFTLGAGVELGLDRMAWMPPGVSVGVDWERYTIDNEPINLWSLGVSYRFPY